MLILTPSTSTTSCSFCCSSSTSAHPVGSPFSSSFSHSVPALSTTPTMILVSGPVPILVLLLLPISGPSRWHWRRLNFLWVGRIEMFLHLFVQDSFLERICSFHSLFPFLLKLLDFCCVLLVATQMIQN